ncbi:hypothetical protein TNCT_385581 [Trichonephila clavata]|uniref:Uncharacterized protein n=1 Tax=Trichonephila clavata TaxID=2740835 RepID=A0A8X6HYK5_TRICU|nr:hypothetical protein TNCT_385581 [Trichonephila clavata]
MCVQNLLLACLKMMRQFAQRSQRKPSKCLPRLEKCKGQNDTNFLKRMVIKDESWCYWYDPNSYDTRSNSDLSHLLLEYKKRLACK